LKRTLVAAALILTLAVGIVGAASSATAVPSKKKACSTCHGKSSAVKIKLTRASETSTTATYSIKVTGGKGRAGWAVLKGATNVKRRTASSGTFTVTKGSTYRVWAVKKGSGAKYKTLSPR
jgi:hypothetical protein